MKEYTRTDNVESIHTYVNSCDKHTLDDAQQWKIYTMRQFEIGAELDFFGVFAGYGCCKMFLIQKLDRMQSENATVR